MTTSTHVDDRIGAGTIHSYNHGDALFAYFQHLHEAGQLVDVTVQSDGTFISNAHRFMLAAFSTHFETALAGVQDSPTITLDIDPKITGVSADDLRQIVDFMYTGRASNVVGTLLESARSLGCVSLVHLLDSDEAASAPDAIVEDGAHAQRLLESAYRFKIDRRFTDVTINCQAQPVANCHRLILCAYSDHFEAALSNIDIYPPVNLDIDSAITGVTATDLRTMVDFMYTGVLRAQRRRFKSLLAAARSLGVAKLVEVLSFQENHHQRASSSSHQTSTNTNQSYAMGAHETDFDDVGATEDVGPSAHGSSNVHAGSSSASNKTRTDIVGIIQDGYGAEETTGRELTAADDYVDIYEEFVAGPRRGRKGGTYGRKQEPLRIKGPAQRLAFEGNESDANGLSGFFDESNEQVHSPTSAAATTAAVAASNSSESVSAVTMSYTPTGKRRRLTDSFGYGLPEIVGTNDVTVPLLVGDQQAMMEKPFKCPYCDHRTKEKSAVEKHIRCIHTLEAPYKCRYCNQAFKVQSNLVRHIRAHTGEKPYVCKKCGAAYADKKNMDAHVFREHLKMKPLECPEPGCPAKFWRQDRFAYHCRRAHALEPELVD